MKNTSPNKSNLTTRFPRWTNVCFLGRWTASLALACCLSVCLNHTVAAQLPQDVRDVFEGMMESLDEDLQKKFQAAIKADTDQVEFTANEFLRFRKDPANPFEGLDRIDVKEGRDISLKFELPSMRNRKVAQLERQNPLLLNQLSTVVASNAMSIVRVYSGKRHIAMGMVVLRDGHIVTKASEVEVRDDIRVQLSNGVYYDAKKIDSDRENDLAILKIPATGLSTISWSEVQPELGSFLITPDRNGSVIALGTYSVRPRSTNFGEQAFLGVQPVTAGRGVRIMDVKPGAASYTAGLRNDDVIYKLNKSPITDVASLVKAIRGQRPGDRVDIDYYRGGKTRSTTATLAGYKVSGERAARFKMMNRLGAVPSRRSDNFPSVFQHDTPLFPEQCGGPIFDLDGRLVGVNIARRGRAASMAIPGNHVRTIVEKMLSESVANAKSAR